MVTHKPLPKTVTPWPVQTIMYHGYTPGSVDHAALNMYNHIQKKPPLSPSILFLGIRILDNAWSISMLCADLYWLAWAVVIFTDYHIR